MAEYELTSPSGEVFVVTAPEDATEQQVMAYFQQQMQAQPTQPEQPAGFPSPERFREMMAAPLPEESRLVGRTAFPEALGNIPSSAANVARQALQALTEPRETLRALGGTIESGLEAINPFMSEEQRQASPYRPYGEAFVRSMSERYGTPARATQTFAQDPVGAMADVSGTAAGTGAITRTPSLTRAGLAMDPVNVALNAPVAAATAAMPSRVPAALYESAAKFPRTGRLQDPKVRDEIVETALRERIMPTFSGVDKINERLGALDTRINELIEAADATGKTVARDRIYSELGDLRRDLSGGVSEFQNMKKAERVISEVDEILSRGPQNLTPSRLQEFKTKTYRDINWKKRPGAKTQTMQALARGARKAIEEVTPEIADVNRLYGPLAELRDPLQGVAARIGNLNVMGLQPMLGGAAGGAAGGVPGLAAGAAIGALDFPRVKAGAALGLRGLQERGPGGIMAMGSPYALLLRQALMQGGELQDIVQP